MFCSANEVARNVAKYVSSLATSVSWSFISISQTFLFVTLENAE